MFNFFIKRISRGSTTNGAEVHSKKKDGRLTMCPMKTGDSVILGLPAGLTSTNLTWLGKYYYKYGKHFGSVAVVARYPSPDSCSWMDVEVNPNLNLPMVVKLKWPKSLAMSLTNMLSNDVLCHIFSFLLETNGDKKSSASIQQVARFYAQMAIVCRRWKQVIDDGLHAIVGLLDLDLVPTTGCRQLALQDLRWLCRQPTTFKLRVRSLRLSNLPSLAERTIQFLHAHDTTNLQKLHLDYSTKCQPLLDDRLTQAITQLFSNPTLLTIHICFQFCSRWPYRVGGVPSDEWANSAFALPTLPASLKRLELGFGTTSWGRLHHRILMGCLSQVSQMEGLQELTICGKIHQAEQLPPYILVKSDSLVSLDVTGLEGLWVFCQCPRMEHFQCMLPFGHGTWRSGALPEDLSASEFYDLPPSDFEVLAGSMPFVGIEVPPSCLIAVKKNGVRTDSFSVYENHLRELQARLATIP